MKEKVIESAGVKDILDIFYKINPSLNWGNKTYRSSASWLIKQFGIDSVIQLAEAAVSIQGKPYAPVVTNPYELKEKMLKIKLYFDRSKSEINLNATKIR